MAKRPLRFSRGLQHSPNFQGGDGHVDAHLTTHRSESILYRTCDHRQRGGRSIKRVLSNSASSVQQSHGAQAFIKTAVTEQDTIQFAWAL